VLSDRRRHVLNVVVSQLDTAIFTAGSFIVTPAVLGSLGDAQYGGWLLINSFIAYMRMLDLGTSAGTVKFGAGAHGRGDRADLVRVLDTSAAMFLVIAALAAVVTAGLAWVIPRAYPIAEGQEGTILLLGGAMVLELAFRPFSAALRMRSLHFLYDSVEIGTYLTFKLGLVLFFAWRGELTYHVLALLTFGETVVRLVLVASASLIASPFVRALNPFRAQRAMVRKLATMGAAVSIIMVADIVCFQLDAGVIGTFMPDSPESIAVFGVGTRLLSIAFAAISVIANVLIPRFSALSEVDDREGMLQLLRSSSLSQGLVSSLGLAGIAVLGPHFLALWLGTPWIGDSAKILHMLIPSYFIALFASPGSALLMGRGRLRRLTMLAVAEAIANLGLSIALVFRFGIYGVALGTAIPLAISQGLVFPFLLRKEIGLPVRDYLRMNTRAAVVGLVFVIAIGGVAWIPIPTFGWFFLVGGGCVVVYAAIVMALVPNLRRAILERLRRRDA